MSSDGFALYRHWIERQKNIDIEENKRATRDEVIESLKESASYHENATVNGINQPIIATRTGTKKAKITVLPNAELYIGDLVGVFGEKWLCVELHSDEYGITSGEIWMCNHIFRYQDRSGHIIEKHSIIDDGSYSKETEKAIQVTKNSYECYISLDDESRILHVDKRLALGKIYNASGSEILEVGKITWMDFHSKNFGSGSHLLTFGLADVPYNAETDSLEETICDFENVTKDDSGSESTAATAKIFIAGRTAMRIGTGRTYAATIIGADGNKISSDGIDFAWTISENHPGVKLVSNGSSCVLNVPLDGALVGSHILLKCSASNRDIASSELIVEVISIG